MFIRPVGVTVRSADRPSGHPLLRGLLAQATGMPGVGAGSVDVDVDGPRQGVRWRTTGGPIEPVPVGVPVGVEVGMEVDEEPGRPERPEQPERPERPEAEVPVEGEDAGAEREPESGGRAEGAAGGAFVAELTQLAALAREGLLTPQEFTTAKGRLLRG